MGNFEPDYGKRLGSVVGEGLQSFANMMGFGEYKVEKNSLLKSVEFNGTDPPYIKNSNRGEGVTIRHREYIGDLVSGPLSGTTTAYDINDYALNPGNRWLFPFLCPIACQFQEWRADGIIVELKSLASSYAGDTTLGAMFAVCDYNSLMDAPVDKRELENMEYAVSCKPSSSIFMPIECKKSNDVNTHLYVAKNETYQGGDQRLSNLGRIYIGTEGVQDAGVPIAEIWITYEITLFKPRLAVLDHTSHCRLAFSHFQDQASKRIGTEFIPEKSSKHRDEFAGLVVEEYWNGSDIWFGKNLVGNNYVVIYQWASETANTAATETADFTWGFDGLTIIEQGWDASPGFMDLLRTQANAQGETSFDLKYLTTTIFVHVAGKPDGSPAVLSLDDCPALPGGGAGTAGPIGTILIYKVDVVPNDIIESLTMRRKKAEKDKIAQRKKQLELQSQKEAPCVTVNQTTKSQSCGLFDSKASKDEYDDMIAKLKSQAVARYAGGAPRTIVD